MGSSVSILHNYDQPLWSPNFELTSTALAYKQGKLDTNRQKLQSLADQFSSLDVLKDQDQDYLENRLQQVSEITNKYSAMDLSDDGFARSLQSNLSQVLDTNVKNAVLSTKLFRSEQSAWEEKKSKDPEKYSDVNRAFAMQNAQAWMADEGVGAVYRGGGGVIEFTDVNKYLTDKLPDIAKQMEWEYTVDEAGNHLFRESNTYKTVPRYKVEAAMNSMLGQKELQQLKINAWGKYSQTPDEQIQAVYDPKINSEISQTSQRLDKYHALMDAATSEGEKQQYRELIQATQGQLGNLNNSKFENIGKEAAYTSMYVDEFKQPFLNAYSYEPIKIKSEVNKLDEATFNANIKIGQEARADKKFQFEQEKFALDLKYKYDALDAQGTGGSSTSKQFNPQTGQFEEVASLGADTPIGEEEGYGERESDLAYGLRLENEAVKGLKDTLSELKIPLSHLNTPSFVQKLKNSVGKDFIETQDAQGNKVKIDLTNPAIRKAINNYKVNVLDDNVVRTVGYESVSKLENDVITTLSKSIVNPSKAWESDATLINFNFRLIPDPKNPGKFTTREVDKSKVKHFYATLLWKKGKGQELTEAEEATLKMYTSLSLMVDPKVNKSQSEIIYDNLQKQIFSKTSGVGNFSDYESAYKRTYGMTPYAKSSDKSDLITAGVAAVYMPQTAITSGLSVIPEDRWLSDLTSSDLEGSEVSSFLGDVGSIFSKAVSPGASAIREAQIKVNSLGDIITTTLGATETLIESEFKKVHFNPSRSTVLIDDRTPQMRAELASQFGINPADLKNKTIVLVPKLNESGRLTGEYTASYQVFDKKEATYTTVPLGDVSSQMATAVGVKATGDVQTQYNAQFGKYAPKLDMGTASFKEMDIDRQRRLYTISGENMPFHSIEDLSAYAHQQGVGEQVDVFFNDAMEGNYEFVLESNGQQYVRNIYRKEEDGSRTHFWTVPTGHITLSEDQLVEMQNISQLENQQAFVQAVKERIPSLRAENFYPKK